MNKKLEKTLRRMYEDRVVRKAIVKRLPHLFVEFYFQDHLEFDMAPFHKEMFELMVDDRYNLVAITGFRGCAKSTLMSTFYPIWLVISGRAQFVLIIAKTQVLAKQIMKNLKDELEQNSLLKKDLGPFISEDGIWGASTITLDKYHAQIMVVSRDQSVRGLRFRQHRPQEIILDDTDDLDSVKTQESRDDTSRWFSSTIVPLGGKKTKVTLLGTPLHADSLIMRIKKDIEAGSRDGAYKNYPIVDENGKSLWPAKFPDAVDIEKEKRRVGDELAWRREYLLEIVSEDNSVVRLEWIKYYQTMPARQGNPAFWATLTGVDLAISKEDSADFTAMVSISVFRDHQENWKIYVHPNPINERLDYPEQRSKIKEVSRALGFGQPTLMYIEAVAYQTAIIQDLRHENFPVQEFQVHGQDKRMRLSLVTHLIENGTVLFPQHGAEKLINQLTGFGSERHDDLADALAIALHTAMGMMTAPGVVFPKPQEIIPPGPIETAETRKIDEWLADKELEFKQGRIDLPHWYAYQDEARERKHGIPRQIASRHIRSLDEQEAKLYRERKENKLKSKQMLEILSKQYPT